MSDFEKFSRFEWRVLRVLARDFLKNDGTSHDACTSRILSTYERRVRNGTLTDRASDTAVDASHEMLRFILLLPKC